jgi:predicted flap endonuclease-1-like 5' DNA nuclease
MSFLIPLIAGGASLIGGFLNRKSAKDANALTSSQFGQQMDFTREQWADQMAMFKQSRGDQYNFAKQSAGWQFDDLMESADQAGIHRLAAIGGAGATQYGGAAPTPGGLPVAPAMGEEGYGFIGDSVGDALSAYLQTQEFKHKQDMDQADLAIRRSEAELLQAQSRTEIQRARNMATSGAQTTDQGQEPEQLMVRIEMPDGSIRSVPVGPELDEILAGAGIWAYDKVADMYRIGKTQDQRRQRRSQQGSSGRMLERPKTSRPSGSSVRRSTR